jgi:hypothetical protein
VTPRRGPARHETPAIEAARHEAPAIDAAALHAARLADRLVTAARERGSTRWATFLEPIPDRLRDDEIRALRATALRARAAYGPKDSIHDALPGELTEPFRDAVDRLLKELARRELAG